MAETTYSSNLNILLPWLARHGQAYKNANGEIHLSLPERLPFVDREDTRTHICKEGEYLQGIAVQYYKDQLPNPVDAWEILAQFQEDPIVDGSLPLRHGQIILVPSMEYIQEAVFGEPLHEFPEM